MIDEVAKLGKELLANIKNMVWSWWWCAAFVVAMFFFAISWGSLGVTLIVHYVAIHKFSVFSTVEVGQENF